MNAVPRQESATPQASAEEQSQSVFWHWFALAVLLICWIAEATWFADGGF